MTEYCLGSTDNNNSSIHNFVNELHRNFTFDELRRLNVTNEELLSWSASIDLTERYQHYINQWNNSFISKEIFFNCTRPWFGPRCQYSFGFANAYSFSNVVLKTLGRKFQYKFPYSITNLTCYTHLKCDRGGSGMCLDWREICDGRIDCIDGGADEAQCSDLEVNECNEDEYRCHNGLCIPKEFVNDVIPHCLDRSDVREKDFCPPSIDSVFDCEDYSCRRSYKQFSCGDGQCVADFDTCKNKRHLLLTKSMNSQGNLSYNCWIAMSCLTKIINQVNETSCKQILSSSNINIYLQTCENITQFPTVPVLFGHVRLLYDVKNVHKLNMSLALTPDYVCYDKQLCDFLMPMFLHGNYSCQHGHQIGFDLSSKIENWTSIIRLIEPYFRKCSITQNNKDDFNHSSLYYCKNSLKYISKHRIVDGIEDCYLNDDEHQFELSCSINDTRRFKCFNENKCRSSLFSRSVCPPSRLHNFDDIVFHQICDQTLQALPIMIDGQNHTDETECKYWPCNNIYTRCDGFWNCPDGEDETNCTKKFCSASFLDCVSPYNYTLTCLPAERVGDGHIDCLGASDELQHCRSSDENSASYLVFRCMNDTKCVGTSELCNKEQDCPFNEDEIFCGDHYRICHRRYTPKPTDVEQTLCRNPGIKNIRFTLETSPIYPSSKNEIIERIADRSALWPSIVNSISNEPDDPTWPWRCHHGLYVHIGLKGNTSSYRCFCPPSYYGDMCQYQNQRVAFTLKVIAVNRRGIYAILVTLIDDDGDYQEINSYNQFTSVPSDTCGRTFNMYLTYSTRPKNSSKNYSIRVDVFDKTSLTYLASWYFKIFFSSLPVNRMTVIITIPIHQPSSSSECSLKCHNGKCMKYLNEERFFCRCHPGWSGVQCNISVYCNDCSSDSICIGEIHSRSICICPIGKGGSRCLLTLSCPIDFCDNNGRCVMTHESGEGSNYACVCQKQFFGVTCRSKKGKLEIYFHNMKVISFLIAYVVYSTNEITLKGHFRVMVILQKLTMFQSNISLYLESGFQMVFIKIDENYYLALVQQITRMNFSTSISPTQRCAPIRELINPQLLILPKIRRVKHFHVLCQTHSNLKCFFDEYYMCLCTFDRHANCFKFDHTLPICRHNVHCLHGGQCLEDDPICPETTVCNCTECFFGDRCQFNVKGIGLTLEDILRYEIRPNIPIYNQTILLKLSLTFTIIMFIVGLINSTLSILTFRTKSSREVGCGIYLLASSITSLLTTNIFTMKFCFLILTHINPSSINNSVHRGGCKSLEFILKLCLYTDNWFNACVAFERLMTVYKGIHFDKMLSKRVARWIIIFLPLFVAVSIIHESLYRDLFDDRDEQRSWCVFYYYPLVQTYNMFILFFHFLCPLCINLFSALFIIFRGARQREESLKRNTYSHYLREQFKAHKNLIISPIILVVLSLPRLIISLLSGCVKPSQNSLLYLSGYFISFIPSMTILFVFVLPSEFYRKHLYESIKSFRRRTN